MASRSWPPSWTQLNRAASSTVPVAQGIDLLHMPYTSELVLWSLLQSVLVLIFILSEPEHGGKHLKQSLIDRVGFTADFSIASGDWIQAH